MTRIASGVVGAGVNVGVGIGVSVGRTVGISVAADFPQALRIDMKNNSNNAFLYRTGTLRDLRIAKFSNHRLSGMQTSVCEFTKPKRAKVRTPKQIRDL